MEDQGGGEGKRGKSGRIHTERERQLKLGAI